MLTISQAFVVLIVFLLIVEFFKLQKACKQFPPGPTPLPLLGNLVHLNFQFHRDLLMELAKTYGNIYTLWFAWAPVIILNGYQAVKDGMTTHPEDVSGRMVSPFFRAMAKGKGIILASGRSWKQQRRFGIMTLRNLGMGKKGLEYRVQEEASHLVGFFVNLKGRPVDPSFPLFHSISNVICALVFGYHFSDEDKTFHELINATENLFRFAGSFVHRLYEIFPWLLCRLPGPHKKALSCYDVLSSFARKEIRRHVERGIPDEPQDFIDFYLAEIEKSKDGAKPKYDEDNLVCVINDLFLGGSETSSTTLYWGLLYMVVNPDIQVSLRSLSLLAEHTNTPNNPLVPLLDKPAGQILAGYEGLQVALRKAHGPGRDGCLFLYLPCQETEKVQKELDAVLGPSQLICYEDRRKLPYTNAVVHEIQRFSNIVFVGLPRVCVRDTTLLGFPIKKGTIIMPNIASVLYDPEQWETPRQFNPGHFLDKEGNFVPREAFLPFSAGHRVCLGEHLARTELFIFFASLLRAFTFRLPEGVTKINTEPVFGGTLQPHPYRVCAIPR